MLEPSEKIPTKGRLPQGSFLGRTLGKISYHGILSLDLIEDVITTGYADDIVIMVTANNKVLMRHVNEY